MSSNRKASFSLSFSSWALALLLVVFTPRCGGGGDLQVLPDAGSGAVTGRVVKGPVAGTTVTAYALTPGLERGRLLGTAIADETGQYLLPYLEHAGHLVLVAAGGSYVDEATGSVIQLADGELSAVVLDYEPTQSLVGVAINPLTHLEAVLARVYVAARARSVADALAEARVHLDAHFGDLAWHSVEPAALTEERSAQLDSAAKAGLVLAGLSWQARMISEAAGLSGASRVTAMTLVDAYARDLAADGYLDGQTREGPIVIPHGGVVSDTRPTAYRMDGATARAHLALAMQRFIASERNATAIGLTDVDAFTNALARDSNPALFRTGGQDLDTAPPEVTFEVRFTRGTQSSAPVGGLSLVRGVVTVTASATDSSGTKALAVTVEGSPLQPAAQGNSPGLYVGTWNTTLGGDGPLTFTATATDSAHTPNTGTTTFTVAVDNTPPEVAITHPTAGGYFSALVPIRADASDARGIASLSVVGLQDFTDADGTDSRVAGSWAIPVGLADGQVGAAFTACDLVGNCTTSSRPLSVDRTPPEVAIVEAPARYTASSTVPVRVQAIDPGAGIRRVYLQNGSQTVEAQQEAPGLYSGTVTLLPGNNVISAFADDQTVDLANSGYGREAPHLVTRSSLYDTGDPAVDNVPNGGSYRSEQSLGIAESAPGVPVMPATFTGLGAVEGLSLGSTVHKVTTRLGWSGVTPSAAELVAVNASNTPWLKFRVFFGFDTDSPLVSARYRIGCTGCGGGSVFSEGDLLDAGSDGNYFQWALPLNAITIPALGRAAGSPVTLDIRVEVTDAAGRVGVKDGTVTVHLVSPPVSFVEDTTYVQAGDPQSLYKYRLAAANYDQLFSQANPNFIGGAPMRVARFLVRNPFPVPVVAQLEGEDAGQWSLLEDWDDDVFTPADSSSTFTRDGFSFENTAEWATGRFADYCGAPVPVHPCGTESEGLPLNRRFAAHGVGNSETQYSCHPSTSEAPPKTVPPVNVGASGWTTTGYTSPLPAGNELTPATVYEVGGRPAWRVPAAVGSTPGVIVVYVVLPRSRTQAPPLAYQTLPGRGAPAYRFHFRDHWILTAAGPTSCQDLATGEEYRSGTYRRRAWYRQLMTATFSMSSSARLNTLGTHDDGSGAFPLIGAARTFASGIAFTKSVDLTHLQ